MARTVRKGAETKFYALLCVTWLCLLAAFGPYIAAGLGLITEEALGALVTAVVLGGWLFALPLVGLTLLASLAILAIGSSAQWLRVITWYAGVTLSYLLSTSLEPLSRRAAASFGALGLGILLIVTCFWFWHPTARE